MKTEFRTVSRRALLATALTAPIAVSARAQAYPTRNPHIIVPFAAGGPTDVLTRIAADRVSTALGHKLVVESRAGAGGNIAAETVLRAEADGYTLLVAGQAILAINRALYKKLSYDPASDFKFVGMLGVIANVLLVNPAAVPVSSVAELIALAKQKPGAISYASNGPGSLTHLTAAMLAHQAGVELLHVPYQGASALMSDLLAGRIGMTFTAASAALPLVTSGQLRALAVTTPRAAASARICRRSLRADFRASLRRPGSASWRVQAHRSRSARLRAEFNNVIASEDYAKALERQSMEIMRCRPKRQTTFSPRSARFGRRQ